MNTNRLTDREKAVYNKVRKLYPKIMGASEILDVYGCKGFVDVTVREGGDVLRFRYYDNGMVTER